MSKKIRKAGEITAHATQMLITSTKHEQISKQLHHLKLGRTIPSSHHTNTFLPTGEE